MGGCPFFVDLADLDKGQYIDITRHTLPKKGRKLRLTQRSSLDPSSSFFNAQRAFTVFALVAVKVRISQLFFQRLPDHRTCPTLFEPHFSVASNVVPINEDLPKEVSRAMWSSLCPLDW